MSKFNIAAIITLLIMSYAIGFVGGRDQQKQLPCPIYQLKQ